MEEALREKQGKGQGGVLCTEIPRCPETVIFPVCPSFYPLASSLSPPLALPHPWVPQKTEQKHLIST